MSDTTTPFLGLTKPAIGGSNDTWGNKENADADLIDANASSNNSRLAALEARCTALENSQWQEAVGTVKWWPADQNFPAGFLFCDGTLLAPSTYPLLFAILGNAWGGDGVNTFAVPDLRGCVLVHMDAGSGRLQGQYGPDRIGGIGGTSIVALTVAQMPTHSHGGVTDTQGDHIHGFTAAYMLAGGNTFSGSALTIQNTGLQTDVAGAHAHNLRDNQQGSGAAHTNCQPGALGYYMIKAANL
jgi:microcystin-dependent protein